jgi:hypothetical protein
MNCLEAREAEAVKADDDQAIGVDQVQPLGSTPGKDDELLTQGRIFGLEPSGARLEERNEEAE